MEPTASGSRPFLRPKALPGDGVRYADPELTRKLLAKYGDLTKKSLVQTRVSQTARIVADVAASRLVQPAASTKREGDSVPRAEMEARMTQLMRRVEQLESALRARDEQPAHISPHVRDSHRDERRRGDGARGVDPLPSLLQQPESSVSFAEVDPSQDPTNLHPLILPMGADGPSEVLLPPKGGAADDSESGSAGLRGPEREIGEAGLVALLPAADGICSIRLEREYHEPVRYLSTPTPHRHAPDAPIVPSQVVILTLAPAPPGSPSTIRSDADRAPAPPAAATSGPTRLCVTRLDSASFELRAWPPPSSGVGVAYIVLEAGVHTLAAGATLIAGAPPIPLTRAASVPSCRILLNL